jgi:hypothetical protein
MKQRFIKLFLSFWFFLVFAAFGAEPTGAQTKTRSSLQNQKGKEVLLLLAKNKEFESINNWLSRTKQSLPAETRELIKGNDLHQRDARKSLASASSSTDSSSGKCLRFLRLVSLKYSK